MKQIKEDIVVVGSGIAGLYYALKCAEFSKVLIITKGKIGESNTMFAQGGIAGVFGDDDTTESHKNDTLLTGGGLCNVDAVNLVVSNAKKCILDLERLSVCFDKAKSGKFDLHKEGGHAHARVVHAADTTGKEVENSLVRNILFNKNIRVLENYFVVDLIVDENSCKGLIVIDKEKEDIVEIRSEILMMASGGAGQIYSCNTNPAIATGDGYAIAYRAGAELMNMEFVQFHPTVLFPPTQNTFLITEALRGFGAELKNGQGESFMEKYHPMKSLAPRDIVSRAIFTEMNKSGEDCVFLDLRSFDKKELTKHFPNILRTLCERGIDCKNEMVPVIPAAHYICGGIRVDLHGKTSIENLYACGEVACTGLHGANRLASNSLLEGLVFAEQAAISTWDKLKAIQLPREGINYKPYRLSRNSDIMFQSKKEQLQKIMWQHTGIVRNAIGLNACIHFLSDLYNSVQSEIRKNGFNVQSIELLNMIHTSLAIAESALQREESRGCHYRGDYPKKASIAMESRWSSILKFHPKNDKSKMFFNKAELGY